MARTTPEARYVLMNSRLTVRESTGEQSQRELGVDALMQTLHDTFGLPVEESWRAVLVRTMAVEREPA